LLSAVCSPNPDREAWQTLEALAIQECGPGADAFLTASLTESLKRLPREQARMAMSALADLLAQHSGQLVPLFQLFAASKESVSRRLGWALARRVPLHLNSEILESLLRGFRTREALERLDRLERRVGPHSIILDARRGRLENIRMRCSRCSAA